MTAPMIPTVSPNVSSQVVAQQAQPQTSELAKFLLALRAQQDQEAKTQIDRMTMEAQIADAKQRQSALIEAQRLAEARQQAMAKMASALAGGDQQAVATPGVDLGYGQVPIQPTTLPGRDALAEAMKAGGAYTGAALENKGIQDLVKSITDARAATAGAKRKNVVVGNTLVNEATGKPIYTESKPAVDDDASKYALFVMKKPNTTGPGQLSPSETAQYQSLVNSFRRAIANNTIINNKSQDAFDVQLGNIAGQNIDASMKNAVAARSDLRAIKNATDALDAPGGVITGAFAKPILKLGAALKAAGIIEATSVVNTQNFLNATGRRVLAILKNRDLGSGQSITDGDREFATGLAAGKIDLTEENIRAVLDLSKRAAETTIQLHNKSIDRLKNKPDDIKANLYVDATEELGAVTRTPEPAATPSTANRDGQVRYQGKMYPQEFINGKWYFQPTPGTYLPVSQAEGSAR